MCFHVHDKVGQGMRLMDSSKVGRQADDYVNAWLYRETLTAASFDTDIHSCLDCFPMARQYQDHAVAGILASTCKHGTTPGSPEPVKSQILVDEDVTKWVS